MKHTIFLSSVVLSFTFTSLMASADICGILQRGAHQAYLDDGTENGINFGKFSERTINLQVDTCVCFEGTISAKGNHPKDDNNVVVTSINGEIEDRANDRSSRCAH